MTKKLNDISFLLGQGGSGRTADGSDFISGLLFYNNTRPAAMLASLPGGVDNYATGSVKQIFSASDAIALGIDSLYTDETKNTSRFTIVAPGATGNTATFVAKEWSGGTGGGDVDLGSYTNLATDSLTVFTDGCAAAINAGTNTHGYSAVSGGATGVLTFTSRPRLGIYPNNAVTAQFYTGTCTGTVDLGGGAAVVYYGIDVVAGVSSKIAVYYYHIERYFLKKPDGMLYIGIFNTAGAATFVGISDMMNNAGGSIVQLGIWDDTKVFALGSLTLIQGVLNTLRAAHKILSNVTYAADIKAIGAVTLLAAAGYNLATLSNNNVSALIDNDGDNGGFDLFKQKGKTISSLGACIGAISEAAISEDMGNPVGRFNADDGAEFDTLMFGDGTFYNALSQTQLGALNNNRYVFLSKIPYATGSWYSDDHCAVAFTSVYAYIHDNRTIDRVIKDSFLALTPVLKSRLKLKTDGTMTVQTIANLVAILGDVIKPLIASGDLAGDPDNFDASKWVLVNPNQKPNVAGKLIIGVKLAANAIAHSISVPIGYGTI